MNNTMHAFHVAFFIYIYYNMIYPEEYFIGETKWAFGETKWAFGETEWAFGETKWAFGETKCLRRIVLYASNE